MTNKIQLFVKPKGTGYSSYTLLDLYAEEPIKITKSVSSLDNPQTVTSGFSRSFRVPNTANNSDFFETAFSVNAQDFDPTQKADAYIQVDGEAFTQGFIRLEKIFTNEKTGSIEYQIIFMGETANFGTSLGGSLLSSLDFSEYSHEATYANITNSWNLNLFGGDIVYPLAEWGYTYDTNGVPEQSTLSKYDGTLSQKGFTNSANPLDRDQFKPSVKAKVIWDKIFGTTEFTYTSEFLNSELFNSLYVIGTGDASPTLPSLGGQFEASLGQTGTFLTTYPADQINPLQFTVDIDDPSNLWDETNATFTAQQTGTHGFSLSFPSVYWQFGSGTFHPVQITAWVNGSVFSSQSCFTQGPPENGYLVDFLGNTNINFTLNINAGDVVNFTINFSSAAIPSLSVFPASTTLIGITPVGVNLTEVMSFNYKQIDFIKSINDRFKLIWEPDPDNPYNFIIEPYITWIQGNVSRDWTDKMDLNADVELTPLFYSQPRELIFKDIEETDVNNFAHQQEYKEVFGQREQDSEIEVITGEKEVKSIFAPVPLSPIGLSNNFLIPHFAKDNTDSNGLTQRQPIAVKPRLMVYNGLQAAPQTWYMNNETSGLEVSTAQNTYPLFSQFTTFPFNNNSLDLNWKNSPQFWEPGQVSGFGSGQTGRTAFSVYWQDWFSNTYDPYSKVMKARFVLDVQDVSTLRFNDYIWIKDSYWQVQEIKDYVLGERTSVNVTLVKIGRDGVEFIPDAAPTTYEYDVCFSAGVTCDACCCEGSQVIVYGNDNTFASSTILYADSYGLSPANVGIYSDGTDALQTNIAGNVIGSDTCISCTCGPTGLTSGFFCSSISLCDACCCNAWTQTLYINGATLPTSTAIYSGPTGGTVAPGRWYSNSSSGYAAFVGADGNTITAISECGACNCGIQDNSDIYALGISATGACCGDSDFVGTRTLWYDNPDISASSFAYYDQDAREPAGVAGSTGFTGPNVVALGDNYIELSATGAIGPVKSFGDPWLTCTNFPLGTVWQISNNVVGATATVEPVWSNDLISGTRMMNPFNVGGSPFFTFGFAPQDRYVGVIVSSTTPADWAVRIYGGSGPNIYNDTTFNYTGAGPELILLPHPTFTPTYYFQIVVS